MTLKEAVEKSLNDRWLPISRAKSTEEMGQIIADVPCSLCEYMCGINKVLSPCHGCPLNINHACCGDDFNEFWNAVSNRSLLEARQYADKIIERIKNIKISEG